LSWSAGARGFYVRIINTVTNSDILKEASTHKSAKSHASTVFVPRDLDLWTPK